MRVVAANVFAAGWPKPRTVNALRDLQADVYLLSEAQHGYPGLGSLGTLYGRDQGTKGARECVVVVGPRVTVHASGTVQLSAAVPGHLKFWHDRWARYVLAECEGQRVALWSWHGNAAIRRRVVGGVKVNSEGAKRYARGMGTLTANVAKQRADGYAPVVGGDANLSRREASWTGSPWTHLERGLGLPIISRGVDQVAYDPLAFSLAGQRIVNNPPGADHDWIVVDLTPVAPEPAPEPTGWTTWPARRALAEALDHLGTAPDNRPDVAAYRVKLAAVAAEMPRPTTEET